MTTRMEIDGISNSESVMVDEHQADRIAMMMDVDTADRGGLSD